MEEKNNRVTSEGFLSYIQTKCVGDCKENGNMVCVLVLD